MNRINAIKKIRDKLKNGKVSIGSWMQIPNGSIAEILGKSCYDWVVIDMEHGAISTCQLPDLFRALELGSTLPLARISDSHSSNCKKALDAGAGGLIAPLIQSKKQLLEFREASCWPPNGKKS